MSIKIKKSKKTKNFIKTFEKEIIYTIRNRRKKMEKRNKTGKLQKRGKQQKLIKINNEDYLYLKY